ncbi:hypothetical protein D5085_07770 [Ectothiorhodospiraceae bacterium BW-2]|nr:hypothetical protein D5085_07770 [Ectothiorhodospiraceae bacterium BW-2]
MSNSSSCLNRLGFKFERGGAHSSRTIMLNELRLLFACIDNPEAKKKAYLHAIVEDNCLGKRSAKTRMLTYRHLVDLYSLETSKLLFRALLYLWNRDPESQPLIALLCSYARDSIFRSTAQLIINTPQGATVARETVEQFIDDLEPGRFSAGTLKSTAQNINASWTKSGHLNGRAKKVRTMATATAGSVVYALLLGYLSGERGQSLFQTEYIRLLECSFDKAIDLAEEASRKGWITLKRVGDVIEVNFPNLIKPEEMEWLREQN